MPVAKGVFLSRSFQPIIRALSMRFPQCHMSETTAS